MLASFARIIGFLTMTAGAAGAVLLGAGFCWFVLTIPAEEVTSVPKLFRVRDARAALPQNCSPSKIKRSPEFCLWHFGT